MTTSTWLALLLGAVTAGVVQGLSGFAFSMVAMSVWAWTIDPHLAAVLAVHGGLSGQVLAAIRERRTMRLAPLRPFLLGGVLGLPVGLVLLRGVDPLLFRLGIGLVLAVWCPLMLASRHLPPLRWGGRAGDALAGAAGGAMAAFGGFSGAAPALWCTLRQYDKADARQVIQNFNLALLALTLAAYAGTGAITREMLLPMAAVTAVIIVPVVLGHRLYDTLSPEAFRRVVLVLLSLSGAAMLLSSAGRLLGG